MKSGICKNCKHEVIKYKKTWLHLEYIKQYKGFIEQSIPSGRVTCMKQKNMEGACKCMKPSPKK